MTEKQWLPGEKSPGTSIGGGELGTRSTAHHPVYVLLFCFMFVDYPHSTGAQGAINNAAETVHAMRGGNLLGAD